MQRCEMKKPNSKETRKEHLEFHAEMAEIAKQVSHRELNNAVGIVLFLGIAIGAIAMGIGDTIKFS
jgi:hypothetical protein